MTDLLRPRPYQQEALDAIGKAFETHTRVAVVLATGLGKTHIFSHAIAQRSGQGKKSLVLVHREELAEQAKTKIHSIAPHLSIGIVKAERNEIDADVIVGSVQTLANPARREYLLGEVGFIVVDECHHSSATTWMEILEDFGGWAGTPCLGVTATLMRADGKGLGDVWETVAYEKDILYGIDNGYLTDVRGVAVTVDGLDLATIAKNRGDYQEGQLGEALEASGAGEVIANAYWEHATKPDGTPRQGILFAPTVSSALAFAGDLNRSGITAATITGTTPREDRELIYKRYEAGEIDVLSSVGVLTEGFDAPWAEVCVMARPTQSPALYCLDDQTEILTDLGWKGIDDDLAGAQPAAFDTSDGSIHWSPLLGRVECKLGADEMYSLTSPTADFRVSAHHRMVWRSRGDSWRVSEIDDLAQRQSVYVVPIAGQQEAPGVPLSDDEIRFVGWYMTDGTLSRANNAISICQSEHQPWNADIVKMLEGCGFKYGIYRSSPVTQYNRTSASLRYTVSKGKPRGRDSHLRGWGALEPYISKDFPETLEAMTREQLLVMLEVMHMADGSEQIGQSWTQRSYHIGKGNKTFIDRLQSLCVRRGLKCNVSVQTKGRDKPYYVAHIKDTTEKWVGGKNDSDCESIRLSRSTWGERVWCVETDAGTIVTRRNGKVLIMGNCQMVGRVLRPWPGKDDALVLDVVGVSGRHKLQSLVDLVKTEVREGESYAEARVRLEKEAKHAARSAPGVVGQIAAQQVELFANSHSSWLLTKGGHWFVPTAGGLYFLWPAIPEEGDTPGTWRVGYVVSTKSKATRPAGWIESGLTLEYAMAWGSQMAEEDDPTVSLRDRSWRRTKPSEGQIKMALRLKVAPIDEIVEMRKGRLSDLISIALASKQLDV